MRARAEEVGIGREEGGWGVECHERWEIGAEGGGRPMGGSWDLPVCRSRRWRVGVGVEPVGLVSPTARNSPAKPVSQ